jgi:hypothetical protein
VGRRFGNHCDAHTMFHHPTYCVEAAQAHSQLEGMTCPGSLLAN